MNLNQLLSLIELGGADSLHFSLDSESRELQFALLRKGQVVDCDGLEEASDLQLTPIVDYLAAAGATALTMRREGDSVLVVRLATEVDGQVVAYSLAMATDSLRSTDEASNSEKDSAMYGLSVAFRKTLLEAQQKLPSMAFGFEGELVLAGGPILCLGGPRDGERVPDAGQFLRLAMPGQVYEKRWYRSAGIDRSFYVHSGTSEAAAATMARAVMSGTTR
jgi:hypothetical protein